MIAKILEFPTDRISYENNSNNGRGDVVFIPSWLDQKASELSEKYKVAKYYGLGTKELRKEYNKEHIRIYNIFLVWRNNKPSFWYEHSSNYLNNSIFTLDLESISQFFK